MTDEMLETLKLALYHAETATIYLDLAVQIDRPYRQIDLADAAQYLRYAGQQLAKLGFPV